ncbi:type IV secretory system conjugative DNA transfer family protein [Halalkalibacter alkalisediminis]|uniref:Type IV secretory system conjugative DNA transfer family protein n=1 Tax=Halalkalibacter alkalisediminis TaxID=935616 RepID=A0ABV6NJ52_9BACI|nr:TraM recognition domain-containing protein [Halalkalibacter alkalisediminis]
MQKNNEKDVGKELGFGTALLVSILFIFPLLVFSIPLYILSRILHKPKIHLILAIMGLGLLILGFISSPGAYLGLYGILPFDMGLLEELYGAPLELSRSSYIMYVSGGFVVSYGLYLYSEVFRKKKVSSKEDHRDKFKESSLYQKVKKNRNKINAKIQEKWRKKGKFNEVLLGITESGKPYSLKFSEINQHHFVVATTGGGKTIYLLNYVEYALAKNYPMIFIDGKGSLETIEEVRSVCDAYGKKLKIFSDQESLTYNPLKYGNATVITDKLKELVETESKYYSEISTSLVQAIIQFIDDYNFKRDLQTFAYYLEPKNIQQVLVNDVIEVEVEEEVKEKPKEQDTFGGFLDDSEIASTSEEAPAKAKEQPKKVVKELSERSKKHTEKIFGRYEASEEGEMYLFENAASVRTQIHLLLDSELGHLFEEKEDGLDLLSLSDHKEALFVSFDGTIYDSYIKKIARFLILDLNYLVSHRNRTKQKDQPLLAIYDEFSVYANDKIVDTVNKSRSAGFHCCIATQLVADLDDVSPTLARRIIGNTNTFAIGHTNLPDEIENWANVLGTFKDNDMTITTEAKGPVNRTEMMGEAGTVRKVNKFKISPDEIRDLRSGQFLITRKAAKDDNVQPEIVYVRHPLIGLQKGGESN